MTVTQDPKMCATCANAGVVRKAHRIMPGGKALCDDHYREEMGLPPIISTRPHPIPPALPVEATEKKEMPEKLDVDWTEAQKLRDQGVSAAELAKKFGVSLASIHRKTNPAKQAFKEAISAPAVKEAQRHFTAKLDKKKTGKQAVIELLKQERDRWIEELEALEKVINLLSGD